MNIENLKVRQVFKNYKEFCKVLEIESKSGNSKLAQFKELETHCKYHKEGNKIIIDEIFSQQLNKVDKRTLGNNNDISRSLRYMILDLLSKHKIEIDQTIGFSKSNLYKYCNMINDNYREAKNDKNRWAKIMNVDTLAVEECVEYTDKRLGDTFRRACSTLSNSNKVLGFKCGYNYVVKEKNNFDRHITAETETENIIRSVEKKVMNQMKISRYDKIYKYDRWAEFKRKVMNILKEEYSLIFSNLVYYYNSVIFNYKYDDIVKEKENFKEVFGLNTEIAKANVNEYFSKSLDGTIERRHKKYVNSNGFDVNANIFEFTYRQEDKYILEQKELKNSIVKEEYEQLDFLSVIEEDSANIPF